MLRRQTTCAPGGRAVDALSFSQDRSALDAAFALIAEGVAYLGDGSELGFGSLADPERWLAELEAPVAVLTPPMLLDAASLADTAATLRDTFRESARTQSGPTARQFPLLSARASSVADLRPLAVAVRRAVLPNGEISDDASPQLKRIRASMGRTRETTASSSRCARPSGDRCRASCTLPARQGKPFSSNRLKPSSTTTDWCSLP